MFPNLVAVGLDLTYIPAAAAASDFVATFPLITVSLTEKFSVVTCIAPPDAAVLFETVQLSLNSIPKFLEDVVFVAIAQPLLPAVLLSICVFVKDIAEYTA